MTEEARGDLGGIKGQKGADMMDKDFFATTTARLRRIAVFF